MSFFDLFIFDPLLKRTRKMDRIQKNLLELSNKRKNLDAKAISLTEEYETLRKEAKSIKKTGITP